jgi:hypothetical protein
MHKTVSVKCKPPGGVLRKGLGACPKIKKLKDKMANRLTELGDNRKDQKRLRKKEEMLEDLLKQDEIKLQLLMPHPVVNALNKRKGASKKSKTGSDKVGSAKVKT